MDPQALIAARRTPPKDGSLVDEAAWAMVTRLRYRER